MSLTLDAGALIGFERGSTRVRALLRSDDGAVHVPATVLAEVWRSGARQAVLGRLLDLERTEVIAFDRSAAQVAGGLLAASRTSDVVDASVVVCAWLHGDVVVTSDPEDLRRLDPTLRLVTL